MNNNRSLFVVRVVASTIGILASYLLMKSDSQVLVGSYLVTLAMSNVLSPLALFGYQNIYYKRMGEDSLSHADLFFQYVVFIILTHILIYSISSLFKGDIGFIVLISFVVSLKTIICLKYQYDERFIFYGVGLYLVDSLVLFICSVANYIYKVDLPELHLLLITLFCFSLLITLLPRLFQTKIDAKNLGSIFSILKSYKIIPQVILGSIIQNFISLYLSLGNYDSHMSQANFAQRIINVISMYNASVLSVYQRKTIVAVRTGWESYKKVYRDVFYKNVKFVSLFVSAMLLGFYFNSYMEIFDYNVEIQIFTITIFMSQIINVSTGPAAISLQFIRNLNYQFVVTAFSGLALFVIALFILDSSLGWYFFALPLLVFHFVKNGLSLFFISRVLKSEVK